MFKVDKKSLKKSKIGSKYTLSVGVFVLKFEHEIWTKSL